MNISEFIDKWSPDKLETKIEFVHDVYEVVSGETTRFKDIIMAGLTSAFNDTSNIYGDIKPKDIEEDQIPTH